MIENYIDDLIAAIDRNTAALLGSDKTDKQPAEKVSKKAAVKVVEETKAPVEATNIVAPEAVKSALDSLLKANKRKEAIALLATFEKATNVTAIVAQGGDVMAAFIEQANEILLSA
jgi:hypothetical protein